GVAEVLHRWNGTSDSDANSYFQINNYSTLDNQYATKLIASTSLAASNGPSLGIWGWVTPGADTSSATPVINIDARRNDATAILNRPILNISNLNTVLFRVNQSGDIAHTITAQAGVGELLHSWTVSDDTGSTMGLFNFVATDGQFSPFWIGSVSTNVPTTIPALGFRGNIPVASDSG